MRNGRIIIGIIFVVAAGIKLLSMWVPEAHEWMHRMLGVVDQYLSGPVLILLIGIALIVSSIKK